MFRAAGFTRMYGERAGLRLDRQKDLKIVTRSFKILKRADFCFINHDVSVYLDW